MFKKFKNCVPLSRLFSSERGAIGIIGVPQSKGQPKPGVEETPDVLRKDGLIELLGNYGKIKVKDYGNLNYRMRNFNDVSNMKNANEVFSCNVALQQKVTQMLNENDRIYVIGGDHSIGAGSVFGHLCHNPDLAVIWVDAHTDINTSHTSPSGNIHGMPVSMFLKEFQENWRQHLGEIFPSSLPSKRLAYIAIRDVDAGECKALEDLNIKFYGMKDVRKHGMKTIMENLFDHVDPERKLNYHVSFDIDSLDKDIAPSTGTPVTNGLTLEEGKCIVETAAGTRRLKVFDLVEINLKLGNENDVKKTKYAAFEILKSTII